MKEMSVCRLSVSFGGNVASIEIISDIEEVDWCGEFLSEIDVAVLCVYAADKIL